MLLFCLLTMLSVLQFPGGASQGAAAHTAADRIVAISEHMIRVIQGMGDFSCEAEAHYYHAGKEHRTCRFTLYWDTAGITRVTFSHPYPGLTVSYTKGDALVTVQPIPFLPFVKFKLSLYHAMVRTPSGQRMDQASVEYVTRFFYNNMTSITQRESSISENQETFELSFWAKDNVEEKEMNRYHVIVAKGTGLPLLIERYNNDQLPIEVIIIRNFKCQAV